MADVAHDVTMWWVTCLLTWRYSELTADDVAGLKAKQGVTSPAVDAAAINAPVH